MRTGAGGWILAFGERGVVARPTAWRTALARACSRVPGARGEGAAAAAGTAFVRTRGDVPRIGEACRTSGARAWLGVRLDHRDAACSDAALVEPARSAPCPARGPTFSCRSGVAVDPFAQRRLSRLPRRICPL